MAVTYTLARPADRAVSGFANGNVKVRYFDFSTDTGTYLTGGDTITAASLGLKHINFVSLSGGVATSGTAGATGLPVGIRYAADGKSFIIQYYEGSAAGTILAEKTNAEAMPSSHTIRVRVEGT